MHSFILNKLSKDEDSSVKLAVAENLKTSSNTLRSMYDHEGSESIKQAIKWNLIKRKEESED